MSASGATIVNDAPAPPGTLASTDAEFAVVAGLPLAGRNRLVLHDLTEAARLWRLCWTLGWLDIKGRYRGSLLGPIWLTLSTAVMVLSLGLLYGVLFHQSMRDFIPFIALSVVLWGYLQTLTQEACTCFLQSAGLIRSIRMPYFVYAGQCIVRNVLVLGHNLIVVVVVYAIFRINPGLIAFESLLGLVLWMVVSVAICVSLGAFCARFRDVPPIVASVMQIAFYLSAVIWKPEQLPRAEKWLALNPFFSMLQVVRGPLLGQHAGIENWISALVYTIITCVISWALFVRVRGRVAFWV